MTKVWFSLGRYEDAPPENAWCWRPEDPRDLEWVGSMCAAPEDAEEAEVAWRAHLDCLCHNHDIYPPFVWIVEDAEGKEIKRDEYEGCEHWCGLTEAAQAVQAAMGQEPLPEPLSRDNPDNDAVFLLYEAEDALGDDHPAVLALRKEIAYIPRLRPWL